MIVIISYKLIFSAIFAKVTMSLPTRACLQCAPPMSSPALTVMMTIIMTTTTMMTAMMTVVMTLMMMVMVLLQCIYLLITIIVAIVNKTIIITNITLSSILYSSMNGKHKEHDLVASSGACISMERRCDQFPDCADFSDEESFLLIFL